MKNEASVWGLSYRKRYYLTHPIKFFKEIGNIFRAAYMRTTKGYCYTDVWNFDDWFLTVAPNMLRHIADYGMAYPGTAPFETPEKWHKWLHEMADKMDECNRDFFEVLAERNEYKKQMDEILIKAYERWKEKHPNEPLTHGQEFTSEEEEIRKKSIERDWEISKEREEHIKSVFNELGEHWDCIWD